MLGGGKGLASHHIQSFDAMCSRPNIQAIFDAETRRCKTDDGRFRVALTNPRWSRPTMPGLSLDLTAGCDESEVTDLRSPVMIGRTYDARLFADPVVYDGNVMHGPFGRVEVCRLPLLRGCRLDKLPLGEGDPGGYFVIDGVERSIIAQELEALHRLVVRRVPKDDRHKHEYVAEIRGGGGGSFYAKRLTVGRAVRVESSIFTTDVPACILLIALSPSPCPVDDGTKDDVWRAAERAVAPWIGSVDPYGVFRASVLDAARALKSLERLSEDVDEEDDGGDDGSDLRDAALKYLARHCQQLPRGKNADAEDDGVLVDADVEADADDAPEDEDRPHRRRRTRTDKATAQEDVKRLLVERFLPHAAFPSGDDDDEQPEDPRYLLARKMAVVAQAIARLAIADENVPDTLDDRDRLEHKRILSAGPLVERLVRRGVAFAFGVDVKAKLKKRVERSAWKEGSPNEAEVAGLLANLSMTVNRHVTNAIKTGNWPKSAALSGGGRTRRWGAASSTPLPSSLVGVSQKLERENIAATRYCVRRVCAAIASSASSEGSSSVIVGSRMISGDMNGRLCFVATPDGQDCGLKRSLALSASLTPYDREVRLRASAVATAIVIGFIRDHHGGVNDRGNSVHVAVDGNILGSLASIDDAKELAEALRSARRRRGCDRARALRAASTSISSLAYGVGHIRLIDVRTDGGRLVRPLLRLPLDADAVERVARSKTWTEVMESGAVEMIDAEEEYASETLVALTIDDATPEHTHLEPLAAAVLGTDASTIPFLERNQGPRCTYGTNMLRQAIAPRSASAAHLRLQKNELHYGQRPIVSTRAATDLLGDADNSGGAGANVVVAILNDPKGYNQEDSLVFNRGAIDRGMFGHTHLRWFVGEPLGNGLDKSRGDVVESDQALVAVGGGGGGGATRWNAGPAGGKARVEAALGPEGMGMRELRGERSVLIARDMVPQVGDKFASRHGQKGTIGALRAQEDMPFVASTGMVPDVLINPHAFPSRMTVGQLLEMVVGKAAALSGSTAISRVSTYGGALGVAEEASEVLRQHGFDACGEETLVCGETGQTLNARVMIGPVYYQRLAHLVEMKAHVRTGAIGRAKGGGPTDPLTRQPVRGRARGGGQRFGEMEQAAAVAHGASEFLLDRLCSREEACLVPVVRETGLPAKIPCSRAQREPERYAVVRVPYAFKLLTQELMSMGILPRLEIE